MTDLSGYEIYLRVWHAGSGMGQPDVEAPGMGPFDSLEEARTAYDKLGGGENFVARKLIELRPKK